MKVLASASKGENVFYTKSRRSEFSHDVAVVCPSGPANQPQEQSEDHARQARSRPEHFAATLQRYKRGPEGHKRIVTKSRK